MIVSGKAQTLEWLAPQLTRGRVLPLAHFAAAEWCAAREAVLARIGQAFAATDALIVRSSAATEDAADASQAGRFLSVPDVNGPAALAAAVDRVVASYGGTPGAHRVLVQPMLRDVIASGVVLTRDPASGAPYLVVNYQQGSDTAAVTGGMGDGLRTFYWWKGAPPSEEPLLASVIALAGELEQLLGSDALDIEFGVTGDGQPVLFQARPLVLAVRPEISAEAHAEALRLIAAKVTAACGPKPYLHGRRTVFGVMPDWNPAEIIGVRPRPLALSLYRDLVTDSIWAYQRHNYGYKNLRSFPLLIDFHGLPYIDVRVSFNSFVPADIEGALADRLVDHYVDRLVAAPALHDKVEFEIVLSCYSFDVRERLARLPDDRFSDAERGTLARSLRQLTNRIINNFDGLWRTDAARIEELQRRHGAIVAADLDTVSRIYWLLEDCKRYGTLPFAGLARAGFIATQMLQSMVTVGIMSPDDLTRFIASVDSVSSALIRDLHRLPRAVFLAKYGHLRPGTYDILSPRYDEAPDRYFDWPAAAQETARASPSQYEPSVAQMRDVDQLLAEHGLEHAAAGLFEFLRAAIRNREHAKFVFTRSLSDALALFAQLGREHGFTADDMSFASVDCIHRLYDTSDDPAAVLGASIAHGRARHAVTGQLSLPPLLTGSDEVWRFHQPPSQPNFITRGDVVGTVRTADDSCGLEGSIVMLPNADPGFDWIFSRRIAGFVTAYGGVNSHMAVRAGELGLPAVIGAGEPLYQRWRQARRLRLDCLNRQVQVLQ